jgi:hypothetical protein
LSDVKKDEKARRTSTGTKPELRQFSLQKINTQRNFLDKEKNDNFRSSPSSEWSSSLSTTIDECNEYTEDLYPSPPEYLNFHEESDSVDEFFLFSQDVLNVDFDTICQELAGFSHNIGNLLKTKENTNLKAVKASNKWNTLWIYRGK